MKKQLARSIILCLSAGVMAANGAQTIRELWDHFPTSSLQGATNGNTSIGYYPSSAIKWTINPADPAATNALQVNTDANIDDWMIGRFDTLPSSWTDAGSMNLAGTTNGFDSGSWAVRFLDTPARINTAADGVYYFSARLIKRSLWWYDSSGGNTNNFGPDDAALGIGFAAGSSASSHFVGAGFTRTVAANGGGGYLTEDGSTEIGDTVYITQGTLGQAGYANHPGDSGGPYYVRAHGWPQWVEGYLGGYPYMDQKYVNGGFLVGKLTTSAAGNDQLQVYAFVDGENVPMNEGDIPWDASYSFNESSALNYLLVWMHGNNGGNACDIDAIRVGTTYADVVGVETFGPLADPTNRIYEGTPLTLSIVGYLQDASATYQWLKAGSPITAATTNASYTITNPTTADSGNFSVIYSNYFGLSVTSQVLTVTVDPYSAPVLNAQPQDGSRFQGSPAAITFGVTADGGRPLKYQWKHIVGGVTNALSGQTNTTLVLTNVQPGDGGGYLVTVTNLAGSTNSRVAAFSVVVPAAGSYAAMVLSKGPYAYWPMDETNSTILHDNWGGHDGAVLDQLTYITNVVDGVTNVDTAGVWMGVDGVPSSGFPGPHVGIYIPISQYAARANLSAIPACTNQMTFCCWVYSHGYPPGSGGVGNGQGTPFLLQRNYNDNGGYGIACGLGFWEHYADGTTNSENFQNQLGYKWGGGTENPGEPFTGYTFTNSGLYMPSNHWTFVALVVNGNQTTMYMGTNNSALTSATDTLPSSIDPGFPNTTYTNSFPLLVGRTGWPWAEPSAGWANANLSMSDIAVFYSALSASDIHDIYLGALGVGITTSYSSGNLYASWPLGTLQAAPEAYGVYTNVPGATSPYLVQKTGQRRFFRIKR